MEFDSRKPIYIQIMDKIKKDIISQKLKKGEKISSGRTMAAELKVNVNTVQRVYQELEKENVIYTLRGIGSFITEDEEVILKIKNQMANDLLNDFIEGMKELGFKNSDIIRSINDYMKGW